MKKLPFWLSAIAFPLVREEVICHNWPLNESC